MLAKNSFALIFLSCFVAGLNAQILSYAMECEFGDTEILGNSRYTCTLSDLDYDFSSPFYFIRLGGQHGAGRSNSDVQNLRIRDSIINRIPANIFNVLPNVQSLEVINCGTLSIIPPDFFFAARLREIRMVENQITRLTTAPFINAVSLETLILENNGITDLGPNPFAGLVNTRFISIANNEVQNITTQLMRPLRSLTTFDASNNAIQEVDGRLFWHSPNIEIVNFSGNSITAVGNSILNINENLQQFWMEGNGCANENYVISNSVNLETIREGLVECFANSPFGTQITLNVNGNLIIYDENDQVLVRIE